jgi:hypothetical protein
MTAICQQCGASAATTLLVVCDVLVVKALESLGKYIVRADRSRYRVLALDELDYACAHTRWPPDVVMIGKALRGAWDVVPPLVATYGPGVSAPRVTHMLDEYVTDLALTGSCHSEQELGYRFRKDLNLSVPTLAFGVLIT